MISHSSLDAPTLYFDCDSGIKLTKYIEGKTFKAEDVAANIPHVANCLRSLHKDFSLGSSPGLNSDRCLPAQEARPFQYEKTLEHFECHAGTLPAGYSDVKRQVLAAVKAMPQEAYCLCHNDLVPENLILDDDRLYLIDWEYSGLNDPFFDLASCAQRAGFTPAQTRALLACYLEREPTPQESHRLLTWQLAQNLLWSVWAFCKKEAGDENLDESYGPDRFERVSSRVSELTLLPAKPTVNCALFLLHIA